MPPDTSIEDPVAAVEEVVEEPVADEVVEEPEAPKTADRLEKMVQGIKDKLDAPSAKGPSQEEIRKAWREEVKKQTGMSDAQLDFTEGRLEAVVAPLYAQITYGEWKLEKGELLTSEIEKGIKEYLKRYPATQQNDKALLDNIFFMEIGKQAVKKPAPKPAEKENPPAGGGPRRKIVSTNPPPATGLNGGDKGKAGAAALSADELKIAAKMRITPEEYAQAKTTIVVGELKKK